MLGWVARGILVVAGGIAGWFLTRDDPNFTLVEMAIAIALITLAVGVAAFWPALLRFLRRGRRPPA